MFCCTLLYVHSCFAITLMGKRELVALLSFVFLVSRNCCVALPRGAMGSSAVCDFVILVFPDHTHLLFK